MFPFRPALLGFLVVLQQASASNSTGTVNADRYGAIRAQGNATQMSEFVTRVVHLFGGRIGNTIGLIKFSEKYIRSDGQFNDIMSEIAQHPTWAIWDEYAACVADRNASQEILGKGIAYACDKMKYFDCKKVPVPCKKDIWKEADYIFSVYFNEQGGAPYPTCHMGGAAIYQPASIYHASPKASDISCVVTKNPLTTPITHAGYHAVINQKNMSKTKTLILRIASSRLIGPILNDQLLQQWSANPPEDFQNLLKWIPSLLKAPVSGAHFRRPSWEVAFFGFLGPCVILAS
jgi:hypothetical protein